jgi:hypothetical protein
MAAGKMKVQTILVGWNGILFWRSKRGRQKSLVLRREKTGKEGPEEGVDPQVLSSHQTMT